MLSSEQENEIQDEHSRNEIAIRYVCMWSDLNRKVEKLVRKG